MPLSKILRDKWSAWTKNGVSFSDKISAATIIEIDIEIAIFHGDRIGSSSRSFLLDLRRLGRIVNYPLQAPLDVPAERTGC